MMRILTFLAIILFLCSCKDNHFIKDKKLRIEVNNKFNERKELAKNRSEQLFSIFEEEEISTREREALMFLFAYMPLCDLADYNGKFFLNQVQTSFEAKDYFSWGPRIPDEIFRHFVLPYRVNNENLDSARQVFFHELKDRIKGMSMKEAVLEVNHWCHEKVNYQSTDIRTSSPLCTVKNSFGRCGEESTFTVAALRAVSIPARQVYTPRWAHCDDNHAWVEVWVDGTWHFLGACEPEADLNNAWFTEPARRAMLVHTKVFGDYNGGEEVLKKDKNFTEINTISTYADTKTIHVKVMANNKPIEGAKVDFCLYNYAEFYPIASKLTNNDGSTSLTTGFGDLLIWASNTNTFSFKKLTVGKTDTLVLDLSQNIPLVNTELDIYPPIEKKIAPHNSDKKLLKQRLLKDDSIRNAYKATFIDSVSATAFAKGINTDLQETWRFLNTSQGNWEEIKLFIMQGMDIDSANTFALLKVISSKDLRDCNSKTLLHHLGFNYPSSDSIAHGIFAKYILNPRIKNEKLVAYKEPLHKAFNKLRAKTTKQTIDTLLNWIKNNISINEQDNYYDLPITPIGVYELKVSNHESRDIFFVAACRSLGIASRLETSTKTPQYFENNRWINVKFEANAQEPTEKGVLILNSARIKENFNPQYYKHFSIAKLNNAVFKTLDFGWDTKLNDMPDTIWLEVGKYRLITGMRQKDGSVLTQLTYFNININDTAKIEPFFRENPLLEAEGTQVTTDIIFPINDKATSFPKDNKKLLLVFADFNSEPSKHLLKGMERLKNEFQGAQTDIILITEYDTRNTFDLPSNAIIVNDKYNVLQNLIAETKLTSYRDPIVFVFDAHKKFTFFSYGYNTAMADEIIKHL